MAQGDDPVFTKPEEYGIENLEAPGEPDRSRETPSAPVPGTGREAKEEHMRAHDDQGAPPPGLDTGDKRDRIERHAARDAEREGLDEAGL